MGLKSYRLISKKKEKRKKRGGPRRAGRIVSDGITALIGVGFLSATSDAVARI